MSTGYGSIRRVHVSGQSSISGISLLCETRRGNNLLIGTQRHDGTSCTRIVNIVKMTVFPMSLIVHLAKMPVGPLVVKFILSHAALDE